MNCLPPILVRALCGIALLTVVACGKPQVAQGINDPYEAHNRAVHEFNKDVDRNVLKPLTSGLGGGEPGPVGKGLTNLAGNLSLPSYILNDVLQANVDDAAHNFVRLLINTTFGIGGLLDPASAWGLPERDTDFGETLHVWGAAEGHYVELPFIGPSTKRDTIGKIVDVVINPLNFVLDKPERYAVPVIRAAGGITARYQYGDLVDSILYDSEDSYAQARLLYLENRRFKLSGGTPDAGDGGIDPYEDPYGIDPYAE